jgi:hypothetical protein
MEANFEFSCSLVDAAPPCEDCCSRRTILRGSLVDAAPPCETQLLTQSLGCGELGTVRPETGATVYTL